MRIVATILLFGLLFASDVIAEDAGGPQNDILTFRYVVKDAPVWTADGKFDPAVLVKLIEASTDFGQNSPKPVLQIHPHPKTGALFISTTIAGHEQIWKLLKQFPALAAAWKSGPPNFPELLEEQIRQSHRFNELNRVFERIETVRLKNLRKRNGFGALAYPFRTRP